MIEMFIAKKKKKKKCLQQFNNGQHMQSMIMAKILEVTLTRNMKKKIF